jgi:hypothetical protein
MAPSEAVINDHLGDAYFRVGRKNEARFQWRKALAFLPDPKLADDIRQKLKTGGLPAGQAVMTSAGEKSKAVPAIPAPTSE